MSTYSDQLQHLTALQKEMRQYRPLDLTQLKALANQVKIEHVWSSNAIEGSSLTKNETATIINTGLTVSGKPLKEAMEVLDLSSAYDYMMELVAKPTPLTETIIRDLNRLVMIKTSDDLNTAGAYRVVEAWPYGSEDQPYTPPYDIKPQMQSLIEWSRQAVTNLHPVEYAAELHQQLVSIHPFSDGNGRTSRLVMNLALTEAGYPVINIQPDHSARNEYIKALEISRNGNPQPFKDLVAKYAQQALEQRISILKQNEINQQEARHQTNLPDSFFHQPKGKQH